ncbi:DNA-(apurinic or apyrimidinic site) endonuclease isoform X3 [Magnolia sinica]|uniref:DNA-(apurinic or apyrimidinic site) endonuclease isoform X3 n=1 Tax=Magnolia sinica TaxID=86752 RepID=UPI00265AC096|nr:DNA-(apurinic or apyrimidinic site) endonuclease isoform X3 [Magnolia sinica]
MKRFFQTMEKDGSFKKPSLSPSPASASEEGKKGEEERKEPLKFLTWNANSFLLRVKNNWPDFSKFVETLDPDVIAIQMLMRAISTPPFRNYRVWWSLADSKYGGTALFVKKHLQLKKVSFCLDREALKHEPDGRVILAEFETIRLLNTYVPNNGWKEDETSFKRRRKWDKRILEFVLQSSDKPLIWCGDLNVSHQDIDVSHPDFFRNAKLNGYIPPNKEDCGQPGFTLAERMRFSSILSEGKLIDAYRFLHKEQDMEHGFSWSGNPVGKYRGKRMRIDYFIVSEQLKDRIIACDMHGQGIELQGFYGSDHCPVSFVLSPTTSESNSC